MESAAKVPRQDQHPADVTGLHTDVPLTAISTLAPWTWGKAPPPILSNSLLVCFQNGLNIHTVLREERVHGNSSPKIPPPLPDLLSSGIPGQEGSCESPLSKSGGLGLNSNHSILASRPVEGLRATLPKPCNVMCKGLHIDNVAVPPQTPEAAFWILACWLGTVAQT